MQSHFLSPSLAFFHLVSRSLAFCRLHSPFLPDLAGAVSKAWLQGLRKMIEGVKYIASHPLLPGLYALDWGFTCVSFYRELFPMWVGDWLTAGVPSGMCPRHPNPRVVALQAVAEPLGRYCICKCLAEHEQVPGSRHA